MALLFEFDSSSDWLELDHAILEPDLELAACLQLRGLPDLLGNDDSPRGIDGSFHTI